MLLNCTNKGCYANDEHKLDLNEDKVICDHCGKEINVPVTTKKMLKTLNQVRKKAKTGIQITCKMCDHTDKPILVRQPKTTIATCRKCGSKLEMHQSFINAMVEMGSDYLKPEEGDNLVVKPKAKVPPPAEVAAEPPPVTTPARKRKK